MTNSPSGVSLFSEFVICDWGFNIFYFPEGSVPLDPFVPPLVVEGFDGFEKRDQEALEKSGAAAISAVF
jgi:hypothetical protein